MTGLGLLIGADSQCDVQMRSVDVAPKHCLITRRDRRVLATRLNIDFPLLRNGVPIAESVLEDGDTLTLGPFAVQIAIEQPTLADSTPESKEIASGEPLAPLRASAPKAPGKKPTFQLLKRKPATNEVHASLGAEESSPPSAEEAFALAAPIEEIAQLPASVEVARPADEVEAARAELAVERRRIEQGRADLEAGFREQQRRERELGERDDNLRTWQERLREEESSLGRRHRDLAEQLQSLEERRHALEQRRTRLLRFRQQHLQKQRRRRSALASLLAGLDFRETELKRKRGDLEEQAARWQRIAESVEARRIEVEQQSLAASELLGEIQRDQERLHVERTTLEQEWHALLGRHKAIEAQRKELEAREAQLRSDEADLETVRREIALDLEQLRERNHEVDRRQDAVGEREVAIAHREEEAAQKHAVNERRQEELDAKAAELVQRAQSLQGEIEQQRTAINRQRNAVEADAARHEAAKTSFEQQRLDWQQQSQRLELEREQLARHASLLAARERELSAIAAGDRAEREKLRLDRVRLTQGADEIEQAERALREESQRLAAVAHDLEIRQQNLLSQERNLAASAEQREAELESRAAVLRGERDALEREVSIHRQRVDRLKAVGLQFAQRRKAMRERLTELDRRFSACQSELTALGESHRRLQAALADYLNRMRERERAALDWLRSVRAESGVLAEAQANLGEQIRSVARGEMLERSLGAWSASLVRLQQSLVEGESVLALPPGSSLPNAEESTRADFPPTAPIAQPPAIAPDWLFRLSQARLADEEVLRWMVRTTPQRRISLEQALVEDGVVTQHQLECARNDRLGELLIGPARVLDVIHRGAVATTYRAILPGYDRPMALRLLDARYGRSEELRTAYRRAVEPLLLFRHPNLAAVHEFFAYSDCCGVIADVAPGEPLSAAARTVPPAKAVDYCRQVVAGLLAAQQSGFVHHSLRPSRILVTQAGRVLILGYGEPSWLGRLHRCELGNTANYYVAPEELAADRPVDARADLFAVGRIFLELALGRRADPAEPIALPPAYPRGFGSLLAQLTDIEPERRCQSAAEVLKALDQLILAVPVDSGLLRAA
jgi:hypothetical protein